MTQPIPQSRKSRICRLTDIPLEIRRELSSGSVETASWTEWMATDMSELARNVAASVESAALKNALLRAADQSRGLTVLARLKSFGRELALVCTGWDDPVLDRLRGHHSDVVRHWAAYAVNDETFRLSLPKRLAATLPFAADKHMSVRECAWMAFRPHLTASLANGLKLLEPVSLSKDANLRRFAIEVTRPRSVWGAHIAALKEEPSMAVALLDNVYQDSSQYVRLSAGNWLNDASKTRPDWVRAVCSRWSKKASKHTEAIIRRGLRTLNRQDDHWRHGAASRISTGVRSNDVPSGLPRRRAPC